MFKSARMADRKAKNSLYILYMKISKEIKERAEKLKITIDEYRYKYHVLNDPTITDEIYDSLMEELRVLEKQFPEA